MSVAVLAGVAIAASDPTQLSCASDRFSIVSITRSAESPGFASPEDALYSLKDLRGFPAEAKEALDGTGSVTEVSSSDPNAGTEFIISRSDEPIVRVGITHLEDGTWAPGAWTQCE